MPPDKNFLKRIEILDELLGSLRRWKGSDLLNKINEKLAEEGKSIERVTFFKDLNYLEYDKAAPLHRPEKGNQYYYYTKKFSLKDLPLGDEDVTALREALDILRQVNNFSILDDVEAVIQKLENRLHTGTKEGQKLIQFEKVEKAKGLEHFDDIYTALKNKCSLRIVYRPYKYQDPKELLVHPYLLKEHRNRWFLFARIEGDSIISNFALDRIEEIKNSIAPFQENDVFDPETYFTYAVGVSIPRNLHPQPVILKVKGNSVNYVKTKPLHANQTIIEEQPGSMLLELTLVDNYELRALLLSYGPGIEVLAPTNLREEIVAMLRESLLPYQQPLIV